MLPPFQPAQFRLSPKMQRWAQSKHAFLRDFSHFERNQRNIIKPSHHNNPENKHHINASYVSN